MATDQGSGVPPPAGGVAAMIVATPRRGSPRRLDMVILQVGNTGWGDRRIRRTADRGRLGSQYLRIGHRGHRRVCDHSSGSNPRMDAWSHPARLLPGNNAVRDLLSNTG